MAAGFLFASCSSSQKSGAASGAAGSYSHALHTRFYEAWVEPEEVRRTARRKISVPVDVLIDKRGRVQSFKPLKRSGFPAFDASVAAVGRRVRKVAPPPDGNEEFRLRIHFVLDIER